MQDTVNKPRTLSNSASDLDTRWVRSRDGVLAGVCAGLGKSFGIDPWLLRALWLVSILAFGTGLLLYVILAFTLPRADQLGEARGKRVLGVCLRLSRNTRLDVGAVRALTVLLALVSLGATVLVYFILHFVLDDEPQALIEA